MREANPTLLPLLLAKRVDRVAAREGAEAVVLEPVVAEGALIRAAAPTISGMRVSLWASTAGPQNTSARNPSRVEDRGIRVTPPTYQGREGGVPPIPEVVVVMLVVLRAARRAVLNAATP